MRIPEADRFEKRMLERGVSARFLTSAAVVLILDQVTKALARAHLDPTPATRLLGDFLQLRLVHNAGAAFSLFQGSRTIFIIISVLSIALILYLVLSRRHAFAGSGIALGMILGGALGNLTDRIWLHVVVDFIDMGFGPHRWPTYNVADVGVTLGVCYLAFRFLLLEVGRGAMRQPGG